MGVVGGALPVVHYLGYGEKRATRVDTWDRMLLRRDKKIDRMAAEG
eukprot:CAMPEP_0119419658 /NCGR_PEP_ID=MMETSP1335-20130426/21502_1 /TAXON_ID=259385 /ORGANISM="Chrysoculter rhomboideus, Strain RCC1486" /LENGTH=45 /DNA_ID= /DNA_START= /DNA_END= /DNA_ORIENTATION=